MPKNNIPDTQFQILNLLTYFFAKNPDMRFCQGLQALKIIQTELAHTGPGEQTVQLIDNFFDEDGKVLRRMRKALDSADESN